MGTPQFIEVGEDFDAPDAEPVLPSAPVRGQVKVPLQLPRSENGRALMSDALNSTSNDLAESVVDKVKRRLADGSLVPNLRDGLTAQQLLDRRAEKAADRSFMLNLAMALAGGGAQTPQKLLPPPEEDVIEGEFSEQNLAPAHLRAG
jgi:hypothetical protein